MIPGRPAVLNRQSALLNLGEFRDGRLAMHLSCNITICFTLETFAGFPRSDLNQVSYMRGNDRPSHRSEGSAAKVVDPNWLESSKRTAAREV
jgi:hypothetical protein